jgi:diacylglycerol kinase family enzyme
MRPTFLQRLAAVAAIILFVTVVVASVATLVDDLLRLLVDGVLLLAVMFGAWYALTRTGTGRMLGIVVCVAAVAGIIAALWNEDNDVILSLLVRVALLVIAAALARFALGHDIRSLKRRDPLGTPVPAAARGVLIINPTSGDGKAERHHLHEECRERGIEPVVLSQRDDLLELARDAIDRGADVLGMAGGDGSQGLVAMVAAERGVPMVVVPAGTRNHLALDLGIDRDDVLGALDAYGNAFERPVDLADVNGRVFVNNVSLGLYAVIVRSPAYRDAKADTTLSTLPKVLGPGATPFDLRYAGPRGEEHETAQVIQISNNPYGTKTLDAVGSRPRLDTGHLGVISLEIADDRAASAFLSAVAAGHPERYAGFASWTPDTFDVTSESPIDLGLDGESLSMEPPLHFSIREQRVRIRLPRDAIGYSPAGRAMDVRAAGRGLWRTVLGRPTVVEP